MYYLKNEAVAGKLIDTPFASIWVRGDGVYCTPYLQEAAALKERGFVELPTSEPVPQVVNRTMPEEVIEEPETGIQTTATIRRQVRRKG